MNDKISTMNYPLTEIEKDVQVEDIQFYLEYSDLRDVCEIHGVGWLNELCKSVGGSKIDIPCLKTLLRPARDRYVRRRTQEGNHPESIRREVTFPSPPLEKSWLPLLENTLLKICTA